MKPLSNEEYKKAYYEAFSKNGGFSIKEHFRIVWEEARKDYAEDFDEWWDSWQ